MKTILGQYCINVSNMERAVAFYQDAIGLEITNKIEEELRGIVGIKRYLSFSLENSSLIDVIIEDDVSDPEKVKRDIRDAGGSVM